MLTSLYVRHFAVVEAAEVTFGPGLTVVSGETGAGKSLLVAGARADSAMVRAGNTRAELAAEFDLADLPLARAWLQREELDEDGACQLRRVVRAEGSSKAWINGRSATASQLGDLATLLVNIRRCYRVRINWSCWTLMPVTRHSWPACATAPCNGARPAPAYANSAAVMTACNALSCCATRLTTWNNGYSRLTR